MAGSIAAWVTVLTLVSGSRSLLPALAAQKGRAQQPSQKAVLVSVGGDNVKVSGLIQQVMAAAHANYTLDAGLVDSYCTVRLKNVTVPAALEALAQSCTRPFTYAKESGIYHFVLTGASNIEKQRITVDVQNVSLPAAISAFMKQAHGDYILDRDLNSGATSLVTMNLTAVPFPAALESLIQASSVPISFRVESGATGAQVYHFMSKTKADRRDDLLSGKIRFTDESLQNGGALAEKKVSLDVDNVYLSHAIKVLMDRFPIRYEIDRSVDDNVVTSHLENVPFSNALALLVKASGQSLEYHFQNDVLRFTRKGSTN
jgi:hypothetical protein